MEMSRERMKSGDERKDGDEEKKSGDEDGGDELISESGKCQ